jgi:zinc/manganese transport system substrate-binding protein
VPRRAGRRSAAALVGLALAATMVAACATSSGNSSGGEGKALNVAASINAWGSILAQLGGDKVHETSIIAKPDTDPHDYEPTPANARAIADSRVFVENGSGYDAWAAKSVAANPDSNRLVVDVGKLVGVPHGGNPHRWYSPGDVEKVANAITADLKKADPADASYFDSRRQEFETTALAKYHRLIDEIKATYAGTPVGASESVFAPMSEALGLRLLTPPSFLKAISEGSDPSAADKATINRQISGRLIKVYVFNSQNSTPDVALQVAAAKNAGIPVTTITETLSPANASFQDWQTSQLQALQAALHEATGK